MSSNNETSTVSLIDEIDHKLRHILAIADAIGMGAMRSAEVGEDSGWRDGTLYTLSEEIAETVDAVDEKVNRLWRLYTEAAVAKGVGHE